MDFQYTEEDTKERYRGSKPNYQLQRPVVGRDMAGYGLEEREGKIQKVSGNAGPGS